MVRPLYAMLMILAVVCQACGGSGQEPRTYRCTGTIGTAAVNLELDLLGDNLTGTLTGTRVLERLKGKKTADSLVLFTFAEGNTPHERLAFRTQDLLTQFCGTWQELTGTAETLPACLTCALAQPEAAAAVPAEPAPAPIAVTRRQRRDSIPFEFSYDGFCLSSIEYYDVKAAPGDLGAFLQKHAAQNRSRPLRPDGGEASHLGPTYENHSIALKANDRLAEVRTHTYAGPCMTGTALDIYHTYKEESHYFELPSGRRITIDKNTILTTDPLMEPLRKAVREHFEGFKSTDDPQAYSYKQVVEPGCLRKIKGGINQMIATALKNKTYTLNAAGFHLTIDFSPFMDSSELCFPNSPGFVDGINIIDIPLSQLRGTIDPGYIQLFEKPLDKEYK